MDDRVKKAYASAGITTDAQTRLPIMVVGCDLGQVRDPTAVAVLKVEHTQYGRTIPYTDRMLDLIHLDELDLGTSYPDVVRKVLSLVKDLRPMASKVALLLDATGVGKSVVDLFREENPYEDVDVTGITFTAGTEKSRGQRTDDWNVPVRDLCGAALIALQTKRLRFAKGLNHKATLIKELIAFKVKIVLNRAGVGHDVYEAWREGDHDDIVFAVAMACWACKKAQSDIVDSGAWTLIRI